VIVGVTPPFALVIEDAAGVEAEIAADRAHVAVGGAGDVRRRLRDHGIMLVDGGVPGDLAQVYRGPEFDRFFVGTDRVQLLHAVHVDQNRRRDDAAADIDHEIGAAAERHGLRIVRARRDRFLDRARRDDAELGEGVHQCAPAIMRTRTNVLRSFPRKREFRATLDDLEMAALDPRFRGGERRVVRGFANITCPRSSSPPRAAVSRLPRRRGRASPAGC
jgi:hypothetical protein